MLTITNIDKLIGHEFDDRWETIGVSTNVNYLDTYTIQLGKFLTIYDPNTFSPHKKLVESKTIILDRIAFKGLYKLYNINDTSNTLKLDISLMDTMDKLIAAIQFIK